jgi:hypothetical protein
VAPNQRRKPRKAAQLTLRELQRPAPLVHLVLLHRPADEVVHRALGVPLHDERVPRRRPLLTLEDVEVVVRRVPARVSLGAQRRAEHDQVLGHARVQDVHAAHGAAGVVEDPLGRERRDLLRRALLRRERREGRRRGRVRGEWVRRHVRRVRAPQARGDVVHDAGGRVGVQLDGLAHEGVHVARREDVESLLLHGWSAGCSEAAARLLVVTLIPSAHIAMLVNKPSRRPMAIQDRRQAPIFILEILQSERQF